MKRSVFKLCLFIFFYNFAEGAVQKYIRSMSFTQCHPTTSVLDFSHVEADSRYEILKLNGSLEITEDVPDMQLRVRRQFYRCEESHSDKIEWNCDQTSDTLEANICNIFQGTDGFQPVYDFFNGVSPRLSCPLKKGFYDMSKAQMNWNNFLRLPVQGQTWKFGVKIWTKTRVIFCAEWIVKIENQSSRRG